MSSIFEFDGTEGEAKVLTFRPVGPVAAKFVSDRAMITSIMGPYGSAKTTSCFQKVLNTAMWQRPDKAGWRHSRGMVVRSTYGQLQTNVMEDWFGWFPKTKDNWNGDEMKHDLRLELPMPGTQPIKLHLQVLFRACEDEKKAEALFKGANLTWGWLNEVDTLHPSVRKFLLPRLGRYPGTREGGCAWSGMFCDMNAPDIDNWTYDFLINKNLGVPEELLEQFRKEFGPLFGINFHRQPGGLDPNAENLDNLKAGYYQGLKMTMSSADARRFVDNQFGAVRKGQPVYPEFNDDWHVSVDGVAPVADRGAVLAIDGGSTPAGVLLQIDDLGQIRVLDEIVVFADDAQTVLEQMGPKTFAKTCRAHLDAKWPKLKIEEVVGDPAMFFGEHGEDLAWASEFGAAFGKKVRSAPAKGNRLAPRLEAVRDSLKTNVGSRPGIILSNQCRKLRQGFIAGYVLTRIKLSSAGGRWRDEPDKNDFSHVHDALQYGVMWLKKRGQASEDIEGERADRRRNARRGKATFGKYQERAA